RLRGRRRVGNVHSALVTRGTGPFRTEIGRTASRRIDLPGQPRRPIDLGPFLGRGRAPGVSWTASSSAVAADASTGMRTSTHGAACRMARRGGMEATRERRAGLYILV